jgi:hypothetical protein
VRARPAGKKAKKKQKERGQRGSLRIVRVLLRKDAWATCWVRSMRGGGEEHSR